MTDFPRFPTVTAAALEGECARELEARRALYARLVEGGRMTPAERDHKLAVAAAWLEDARRIRLCWIDRPGTPPGAPEHGLPWKTRRQALLDELAIRGRKYPEWVAGGRLLQAEADRRTRAMECLLAIYEGGWDWRGSDGKTPYHSAIADAEFTALQTSIAARTGAAQEELQLA